MAGDALPCAFTKYDRGVPGTSCDGVTHSALPMFPGAIPVQIINSYLEELQDACAYYKTLL